MSVDATRMVWSRPDAEQFIAQAYRNRLGKANEAVVRQTLIHHLGRIVTETPTPWWVSRHIRGAEAPLRFLASGVQRSGRGDSVVGLTAVEYESDLRSQPKWDEGYRQVRQYCAGLLNTGSQPGRVRGVLSDTVDWHAYELVDVPPKPPGQYDVDDIVLNELEHVTCTPDDPDGPDRLVDFWCRHFGREGTRPLTARSVAAYLAPTAVAAEGYLARLTDTFDRAKAADPDAADLVESLWTRFVSYLSEDAATALFDRATYVQEFYVALLARLICANVLARRAMRSPDGELDGILRGHYFSAKGLRGLVEFDYFGWLTAPDCIADIRPLAKNLQRELTAFDFDGDVAEDLFGEMVSLLAGRAQRLLLGQEWTPAWLAGRMAAHLMAQLPADTPPQFVDMCCGSGAMLIAVTRLARDRAVHAGLAAGSQEALNYVTNAATGFDIDPLAVVLAKVNWVVNNRDWLEPFDGSRTVTLPMFHADSLFALAPVFQDDLGLSGSADHTLQLDDRDVALPGALIEPGMHGLFDGLVERAYRLGLSEAAATRDAAAFMVGDAAAEAAVTLDDGTQALAEVFAVELADTLADLHRRGRNGLWAFVIRNNYRPALVAGRFNGLISNPPWLALSRIEHNPFAAAVKKRAERYGLLPPADAAPHLDMSTPFLAYAVDHYLADGAVVGCVLPGTIRRGTQHRPFREQVACHNGAVAKFNLDVAEVWRVSSGTFKNLAAVVFGTKSTPVVRTRLEAANVSADRSTHAPLYVKSVGDRVVWADSPATTTITPYDDGYFQQGADLMPRTCVFVSATHGDGHTTIGALTKDKVGEKYLLSGSKKAKDFQPATRTIPSRFMAQAWISKHLAPFDLCEPAPCAVPFQQKPDGGWERLAAHAFAHVPGLQEHFEAAADAAGHRSVDAFQDAIDYRSKLTNQTLGSEGWLVLYGAGGTNPAAAHLPLAGQPAAALIDQTLYWAVADTEDEALFQVGMLNSPAVLSRVREFAPEGVFKERHLHSLPSKFLPRYDATQATHARLVSATRRLIDDLTVARRNDEHLAAWFLPQPSLPVRRSRIRSALATLPSFADYDAAADDVYS